MMVMRKIKPEDGGTGKDGEEEKLSSWEQCRYGDGKGKESDEEQARPQNTVGEDGNEERVRPWEWCWCEG